MLRIIVVGAGGTGGYLIPILGRVLNSDNFTDAELHIVDGDIVEPKNVERQNFIKSDIGLFKSQVLANRYRKVFPRVKILSRTEYIEETGYYNNLEISEADNCMNIVISCVDSVDARLAILKRMLNFRGNKILIDSGNEDQYGHVTVSFVSGNENHDFHPTFITTETFKNVCQGNVEVVRGSCATLGEQTSVQNHLQASVIMKMLMHLSNVAVSLGVDPASHPLNNLQSVDLGKEFETNSLLLTTYNTGSLSSKRDLITFGGREDVLFSDIFDEISGRN